jgi:D-alanyl-D-alanine carboxypeptidase
MNQNISTELAQQLQASLDSTVEKTGIPGASVAVINSEGTWYGASGISNLETKKPVNPDDLFKIGSVTKTFTAATILKLVEEEKLNLQDTLDKWLPDSITNNIPNAKDITIEQLLNHTSGIFSYTNNPQFGLDELAVINGADIDRSREAILKNYVAPEDAYFAPGESFFYSNTNYLLLGMLIEATTGNTYQSEIHRLILEPLGLDNTYFVGDEIPGERLVSGYGDLIGEDGSFGADGIYEDTTELFSSLASTLADGGIISNTKDVARFSDALFGGELLQPESMNHMLSWSNIDEREIQVGDDYGLGVYEEQTPWGEIWGHDGGTFGYISKMQYFPESDTTVVVFVNQIDPQALVLATDSVFTAINQTLFGEANNITPEALLDSFDSNFVDGLIDAIDGVDNKSDLVTLVKNENILAELDYDAVDEEKFFELIDSPDNQDEFNHLLDFLRFGAIVGKESDAIAGNEADNTLAGEDRNDTLTGGLGNDLIFAQGGDDLIFGEGGDDTILGGLGNDVFVFKQNQGTDTIFDFNVSDDLIDISGLGDATFADIEIAQQGKDTVIAFDGSDIAILLSVNAESLNADNFVNNPPESIFGTVDRDVIEIEGSNKIVFAGEGDDLIDASVSSKGSNRIYVGGGDDTLILGADSRLFGEQGNDRFFATSGGDNIITGGEGADKFWIAVAEIPDAANTITDFTIGEDVIGIAGLGISFADISITGQENNTLIAVDGIDLGILQGINANSLTVDNFAFT